jgi:hypothetical protein
MENTIQSKTVKLNGVSLIFEIERKGDFSSDIRVCDYSAGRVSIYRINKDHEWEVYDMYDNYMNSMIGAIKNYVLENQNFFFLK